MANKIIPKYRELTTGEPTLLKGEIATNLLDKNLFIGNGAGNIIFRDKDATDTYIAQEIAGSLTSGMTYKGSYSAATNTPNLDAVSPIATKTGDTYTVTTAGTFFTIPVEIGDMLIAEKDSSGLEGDWTIVNKNLDAASIKSSYESNADTNVFTDIEQSKLGNISVTQAVNLDTMESNILLNNAKLTNVTTDITTTHNAGSVVVNSSDGTDGTINGATTISAGVLSALDKLKLDNILGTNTGDQVIPTNSDFSLDGLSNVTITLNATGEILRWNGSAWVNNTLAEAGIEPAFTKETAFNKPFGVLTNTIPHGDDTRFSDARVPLAHNQSADTITTGVLSVLRGGTGVTSKTGTGSVVLNDSPTLTGVPTAPTATEGTSTTQVATTKFVSDAIIDGGTY